MCNSLGSGKPDKSIFAMRKQKEKVRKKFPYFADKVSVPRSCSNNCLPLLPAVRSLRKTHPQKPDITAPLGLAPKFILKLRLFDFDLEIPRRKATVDNTACYPPPQTFASC
jgi:hypothetical protein